MRDALGEIERELRLRQKIYQDCRPRFHRGRRLAVIIAGLAAVIWIAGLAMH